MAKKKYTMPSSQGGLVRYYDEEEAIAIDPKWIIGAIGFLVLLEIFLHFYGSRLLAGLA